jgi:methylmalonyl-CoA/ethylmalonyl-CoA epimerase
MDSIETFDPAASERPGGASMHHVGFVVSSIDAGVRGFAQSIGALWDGKIVHDPIQSVRVTFLRSGLDTDPLVELVEPMGNESPVIEFLRRGGGLHHICYEVDRLDAQLVISRSLGGLVVRNAVPAVAFGGRRIAWVYTKYRLLLEYLEREPARSIAVRT